MIITINGQNKEFCEDLNLTSVIANFCKKSQYIIAEVNGNIVKKESWDQTSIAHGDKIELVGLVGGG